MNTDDRELREKLRKLERIEARLVLHQKTTRFGLMGLSAISTVMLALIGYMIIRL